MRKIKEVLRVHYEKGLSTREIAKSLGIGRSTVHDYLDRSERAGLSWPFAADLDETSLEHRLYPAVPGDVRGKRPVPSMEHLYQELKRKGVTLQLLWHEYKEANPEGYQYSRFCYHYQQWVQKLDLCLPQFPYHSLT